MLFTLDNLKISLTLQFADALRSGGYDVFWHSTGETDPQTSGLTEAKDIVTLVKEIPANPTSLRRLRDEQVSESDVVVPAFTLQVLDLPERQMIQGLGHDDYEWAQRVRIDGFAADEYQHVALSELIHRFWEDKAKKEFPIYDYADPANPVLIGPVTVQFSITSKPELAHEVEAVRYYIKSSVNITYVE